MSLTLVELAKVVRRYFIYSPDTGLIRWREGRGMMQAGDRAGGRNSPGYLLLQVAGKKIKGHRAAWLLHYGEWPSGQIDHINGVKDDNRICNLRDVTCQQNQRNTKIPVNNKTGIVGVSTNNRYKGWLAQIRVDNKTVRIGLFKDKFEAICARKSAENHYGFHANHGTRRH